MKNKIIMYAIVILLLFSSIYSFFDPEFDIMTRIGSVILFIISLIVAYIINIKIKKKNLNAIRLAEEYPEFSNEIINYNKKIIAQNMPIELLYFILGKPHGNKEQVNKSKYVNKLFYFPYKNRQKNVSYKLRVDIENDIVIGWKQL